MPIGDEPPSSPPNASTSLEDALAYYKTQYEQLESELSDFQASSRELEAELEKDIEASEKRERQLKEKADNLSYEVDEWKTKHKQAKAEANNVQNTLQKEITTLRDTNRTLQLRLRDIEVANDDFERQARHTTSSLEDVESKYNVTIERGVMMEEEIKVGEQEREALRIEAQRLRDELSDLKVESEIVKNKLCDLEQATNRRSRKPTPLGPIAPVSQTAERSPDTASSSPTFATAPAKSASSGASDTPTPPSPPISDSSLKLNMPAVTPSFSRTRPSTATDTNITPRPSHFASRTPRHSRGPSIPVSTNNGRSTPSVSYRRSAARPSDIPPLPQSGSLYQIRGLIGKMQKLEERVHSARSRLPAPVNTPPRASPRTGSALGHHSTATHLPSNVTLRSSRKRTGGSNVSGASSLRDGDVGTGTPSAIPKSSRQSFGLPPPTPTRMEAPRPGSRAGMSSRNSVNPHQPNVNLSHSRPGSRQSMSRTPLGGGSGPFTPNASTDYVRPKSSLSNYGGHARGQSMSVAEEKESPEFAMPTPRRLTFGKDTGGALPGASVVKKRASHGAGLSIRRISSGPGLNKEEGDMGPPERRKGLQRTKLSGVGETY